ncbi:MAG TPA: hypothetical protein VM936_08940 [Pyrinomonadaceae bacterium]|jgi:hypothetical protein|nr:hypothetical protein [Pyrinomonadaceae bacterium]
MTNWMRRRIERSRARCEKTSDVYKQAKPQSQETKTQANDEAAPRAAQDTAR